MSEIGSIIDELVNGKDDWSREWCRESFAPSWSLNFQPLADAFKILTDSFSNILKTHIQIDWSQFDFGSFLQSCIRQRNRELLARHRRRRGK